MSNTIAVPAFDCSEAEASAYVSALDAAREEHVTQLNGTHDSVAACSTKLEDMSRQRMLLDPDSPASRRELERLRRDEAAERDALALYQHRLTGQVERLHEIDAGIREARAQLARKVAARLRGEGDRIVEEIRSHFEAGRAWRAEQAERLRALSGELIGVQYRAGRAEPSPWADYVNTDPEQWQPLVDQQAARDERQRWLHDPEVLVSSKVAYLLAEQNKGLLSISYFEENQQRERIRAEVESTYGGKADPPRAPLNALDPLHPPVEPKSFETLEADAAARMATLEATTRQKAVLREREDQRNVYRPFAGR